MEVIEYQKNIEYHLGNLAVTIGAFDGIHYGHLELIKTLKSCDETLKKAIITFNHHPDYALSKRKDYGVLSTLSEKIKIFSELEVDYLIILDLRSGILLSSYKEFNEILVALNVKRVVVGSDFRYGHLGLGDIDTLKENFLVMVVGDVLSQGKKISSNDIRELLTKGDIESINKLMVNPFSITGKVCKGAGVGRTLGYKTANIELTSVYRNIRWGVYACFVKLHHNTYKGVVNIGCNPTINELDKPRLEVHIFDFDCDIYGENLEIVFIRFLRDEIKFTSKEELQEAIQSNMMEVMKI